MKKIITIFTLAILCAANLFSQDTLYVKPDEASNAWSGREGVYSDLQSAIDAALEGDQIWVAAGTYLPSTRFPSGNDNRCKSFILKTGVSLYGGFEGTENDINERDSDGDWEFGNTTTLSGDINHTPDVATDNSYHVVYGKSVSNIVIDGFTIAGGYGDRQGYMDDQKGAGIYLGATTSSASSNIEIRNCIISNNTAFQQGGGAYLPKTCTLSNCLIENNATVASNSAGGGVYFDNFAFSTVVANYCVFSSNYCPATTTVSASSRYGGGGVCSGNSCEFNYCVFIGNQCTNPGGGIYCGIGNKFENCIFYLNSASVGGAIFGNTSSSLLTSNCLFSNNIASNDAGCISISGSSCRSVNCTFVGNDAPANTVLNGGNSYTVYNCVLWNNGNDTGNMMPSAVVKKYTAAEGVQFPGTGNINATTDEFHFYDPCLIVGIPDNEGDIELILDADYTMTGQSVCKDAGNTATIDLSGYQFPEEDLYGEARINGGLIDLGCFEIQCVEEAPILSFIFADTTYNADMPGTGTISATIYIENYDDFYTYYLTYNEEEIEMEDETYSLELNFPSAQTIGVRLVDEEECSLTTDTTFAIDSLFDTHIGIENLELQNLVITPNPVTTQFTIHNLPATLRNAQVEIYDGNGKLIATKNVVESQAKIDVTNYQSGIYFIRMLNDGKVFGTSKIIKK